MSSANVIFFGALCSQEHVTFHFSKNGTHTLHSRKIQPNTNSNNCGALYSIVPNPDTLFRSQFYDMIQAKDPISFIFVCHIIGRQHTRSQRHTHTHNRKEREPMENQKTKPTYTHIENCFEKTCDLIYHLNTFNLIFAAWRID